MTTHGEEMMNCEEFEQAIAADPSFDGGAAHLLQCSSCKAFRAEMRALDQDIGNALRIDVPKLQIPELPELDSGNVVAMTARRFSTPTWFAMAATILVAAVLGVRMFGSSVAYPSLAEEVIAHLDHEQFSLRVSDKPVSDSKLASVVPADMAQMNHSAGLITYARSCTINGNTVPHLVIQGERGPVTILLLPDEKISDAIPLHGENINGVILPVGSGSIAIIGTGDERLEEIEERVVNSVMWST